MPKRRRSKSGQHRRWKKQKPQDGPGILDDADSVPGTFVASAQSVFSEGIESAVMSITDACSRSAGRRHYLCLPYSGMDDHDAVKWTASDDKHAVSAAEVGHDLSATLLFSAMAARYHPNQPR
jgi:hypothetical protein